MVPDGLPSSLTLFLELSCKAGKDILLQVQHPVQLLHEQLTWEGAGGHRVLPLSPTHPKSDVQEVVFCWKSLAVHSGRDSGRDNDH